MTPLFTRTYRFGTVSSDSFGFNQLALAAHHFGGLHNQRVALDFTGTVFFSANLAGPLAAVIAELRQDNEVEVIGLRQSVRRALAQNGFLRAVCSDATRAGPSRSSLPYSRFETSDVPGFGGYVNAHVLGHEGLAQVDDATKKQIRILLLELFVNAKSYSDSRHGVFACGQFYPETHRFDMTIADAGIAFSGSMGRNEKRPVDDIEAIRKVLEHGYSAKPGMAGGLGLRQVQEYVTSTRGRIHIVSGRGMWELGAGEAVWRGRDLLARFPGTIVNIEFNTRVKPPLLVEVPRSFKDLF